MSSLDLGRCPNGPGLLPTVEPASSLAADAGSVPNAFVRPKDGVRFLLIGSHTSTVREGATPMRKLDCEGCRQ